MKNTSPAEIVCGMSPPSWYDQHWLVTIRALDKIAYTSPNVGVSLSWVCARSPCYADIYQPHPPCTAAIAAGRDHLRASAFHSLLYAIRSSGGW